MKNKILLMMSVAVLAFTATSCKKNNDIQPSSSDTSFLMTELPSVVIGTSPVQTFDAVNDQYTFSDDGLFFYVTNADQSVNVAFEFSAKPDAATPVDVKVTANGIADFPNATYRVLKVKADNTRMWVWDQEKQFGAILQIK